MNENITLTIFGDSIPKGVMYSAVGFQQNPVTAVKIIEEKYGLTIANLSCFGQTVKRLYDRNAVQDYSTKINLNKKNMVLFFLGGNDSDFNWREVSDTPQEKHTEKTPLADFNHLLTQLIMMLKEQHVEVFVSTLIPIDSQSFFDTIVAKQAEKERVLQFLGGDVSNIRRNQEIFSNELIKIAYQTNSHLIDVRKEFLKQKNVLSFYGADGTHLNALGQQLLANIWEREFKKFLS